MKKNEIKTIDQKDLLIASIDKDLSDFVSGKIKGITLTLGLVNKLTKNNRYNYNKDRDNKESHSKNIVHNSFSFHSLLNHILLYKAN